DGCYHSSRLSRTVKTRVRPRRGLTLVVTSTRFWLSDANAAQLLCDRDFVAVDAADALIAELRRLLAQLVRLLLALPECVVALPERDHDRLAALTVGETDRAGVALQLLDLRQGLRAHLAHGLVELVGRALQRADTGRLRLLDIAFEGRDLVDVDRCPTPAHVGREVLRHVLERLLGVANRLLAVEERDPE